MWSSFVGKIVGVRCRLREPLILIPVYAITLANEIAHKEISRPVLALAGAGLFVGSSFFL